MNRTKQPVRKNDGRLKEKVSYRLLLLCDCIVFPSFYQGSLSLREDFVPGVTINPSAVKI